MKILVVEDEEDLNTIITKHLKKSGYSVDCAFDGVQALEYIDAFNYDAVVLDVMMPVMDGFELIKCLRARKNAVGVLFLTAKDTKDDVVNGLDLGGDDYLVKPFDFRELLARLRSIIRRKNEHINSQISANCVNLNLNKRSVTSNGENISLTAKEYEILEFLMLNKGKILTRDEIKEGVWDFEKT